MNPIENHFREDPKQAITITFHPEGLTMAGAKLWRAKLRFPIRSKTGWAAESLAELLDAIMEREA